MSTTDLSGMIVVTGAAGTLGRRVVAALVRRGHRVRGLGRSARPEGFPAPWCRADLLSGDCLKAAVRDARVIIHTASAPFANGADLKAARQLGQAAREGNTEHMVFVQIAGIAGATDVSNYYRDKLSAERELKASGIPCSVVAATQFHELVDRIFTALSILPILPVPKFTLQPVDVDFVADRLADCATSDGRFGMTICGPEALTSHDMARAWLTARRRRRVQMPFPGYGPLKAFGRLQVVNGIAGGQTWRTWLSKSDKRA